MQAHIKHCRIGRQVGFIPNLRLNGFDLVVRLGPSSPSTATKFVPNRFTAPRSPLIGFLGIMVSWYVFLHASPDSVNPLADRLIKHQTLPFSIAKWFSAPWNRGFYKSLGNGQKIIPETTVVFKSMIPLLLTRDFLPPSKGVRYASAFSPSNR